MSGQGSTWGGGYVTDVNYLPGWYRHQSPMHMAVTCLLLGVACDLPAGEEDVHYLELGCGLGRSTIWLAQEFRNVVGADISAPHLRMAAEIATRFGRPNISFLNVSDLSALKTGPEFDAFFSIIVLQHNPPPIIHHLLTTILGRLKLGGIAYFQVPTYRLGYTFDVQRYLATPLRLGVPEMHVIPQPELHTLIENAGCRILEMREDSAAGGDHISSRLFVRKVR